jgi:hypothetical protein
MLKFYKNVWFLNIYVAYSIIRMNITTDDDHSNNDSEMCTTESVDQALL